MCVCVCVCVCVRAFVPARLCERVFLLVYFQIQEQASHRGAGKGTLYICLKLIFPRKSERPDCVRLNRPPSSNTFDPLHVIELNHDTFRTTDFQPALYSQQLGSKLHELYDLDIDFTTSQTILAAIVTNGGNKTVTWFLMTEPRPPSALDCAGDPECVTSSSTSSGHVVFPRHLSKLQTGHVYYICAVMSGEPSEHVCGDGVVIDDSPPVKGSVSIADSLNGYLADGGHVTVMWSGFSDVEAQVHSVPDDITLNYSVALGKLFNFICKRHIPNLLFSFDCILR